MSEADGVLRRYDQIDFSRNSLGYSDMVLLLNQRKITFTLESLDLINGCAGLQQETPAGNGAMAAFT